MNAPGADTRIAARIQHHPGRVHLLPELRQRLDPLAAEVVTHASEPPSPWAGYKQCLRDPPDCTHLLIVQDDCVPVPNFAPALECIARANPETAVCLFLAHLPRQAAMDATRAIGRNVRYVTLPWRDFMPVVAVLWPLVVARDFLAWADENPGLPGQREPRSDDAMAGRWKMVMRRTVRATVPSLVQHPDIEPSLIGRRRSWGKDRSRVALFLAEDAMSYDWG